MSLLDADHTDGRQWMRLGDAYEVTKKPRGLDLTSLPAVPFVPMDAIPQDGSYTADHTMRPPGEIRSGTYFERGDALIAKITPSFENGKQALANGLPTTFGIATTEIIPLRPCKEGQDRRLLFFYLLHPDVRHHVAERMEGSTGRQRIPADVLLDLPFPKFDPEEQTTVSDTLEMIQQLMVVEAQSIEITQTLKRAAMRTLFTRGLRGETRKETEIGPVPESWELVSFASVRERLQYGTSVRCTYDTSDHPVLRIPNIEPQRLNTDDLKYCTLRRRDAARYQLEDGDLLFIRTNGVLDRLGSCAVYDGYPANALFASYLIRARVRPDHVIPHFASSFFGSELGTRIVAERAISASDGKFNLNTAAIDSLLLPLPPTLSEQREIVAVLDAIDRKIDLHRRKRAVLEELFKALLHKLMTGEIRAEDLDLAIPSNDDDQRIEAQSSGDLI